MAGITLTKLLLSLDELNFNPLAEIHPGFELHGRKKTGSTRQPISKSDACTAWATITGAHES